MSTEQKRCPVSLMFCSHQNVARSKRSTGYLNKIVSDHTILKLVYSSQVRLAVIEESLTPCYPFVSDIAFVLAWAQMVTVADPVGGVPAPLTPHFEAQDYILRPNYNFYT